MSATQNKIQSPILFREEKNGTLRVLPTAVLAAGILVGTGGMLTTQNLPQAVNITIRPMSVAIASETRRVISLNPVLEKIRSVFGLTMTEFATVFGISRQAAYAWFAGATPKGELLARVWSLHEVAKKVEVLNLSRVSLLKKKPLSSGLNIIQSLATLSGMDGIANELQAHSFKDSLRRSSTLTRRKRVLTAEDISVTQHGEL